MSAQDSKRLSARKRKEERRGSDFFGQARMGGGSTLGARTYHDVVLKSIRDEGEPRADDREDSREFLLARLLDDGFDFSLFRERRPGFDLSVFC